MSGILFNSAFRVWRRCYPALPRRTSGLSLSRLTAKVQVNSTTHVPRSLTLNFSMYQSGIVFLCPFKPSVKSLNPLKSAWRNLCLLVHRITNLPYLFKWYMSSAVSFLNSGLFTVRLGSRDTPGPGVERV